MSVTRLPLQAEVQLSLRDLAVACGISATRAARLVRLGLVEPQPDAPDRFSRHDPHRPRLERLEAELTRLRGQGWTSIA